MADLRPRWIYRLDNFSRAFALLREAVEMSRKRELTHLEQEGVVQRFEYTWELAWKLLKDYLEASGVLLETVTPASTIKAAFAARILEDGEIWMQALDARNKMSHTYSFKRFSQTVEEIRHTYLAMFESLYVLMRHEAGELNLG